MQNKIKVILISIGVLLVGITLYFLLKDTQEYETIDYDKIDKLNKTSIQTIIDLDAKDSNLSDDTKHLNNDGLTKDLPDFSKKPHESKTNKPKVAIIIDDLANPKDIKSFNSIGVKINLSLLPKHNFSRHNPELAKKLDFYMIHLPLEAQSFEQQGVRVLHVGDSMDIVQSYIDDIKLDFPNLKYINNHTGSKYTSSKEDMQRLLKALDKYNITFVDSKTSSSNVIKDLYKERNQTYIARNIFLDNESNFDYVEKQLNKALNFADKHGFVIAIGHPKHATLEVIKKYKQKLKNEYELIYINEMDKWLQTRENRN